MKMFYSVLGSSLYFLTPEEAIKDFMHCLSAEEFSCNLDGDVVLQQFKEVKLTTSNSVEMKYYIEHCITEKLEELLGEEVGEELPTSVVEGVKSLASAISSDCNGYKHTGVSDRRSLRAWCKMWFGGWPLDYKEI